MSVLSYQDFLTYNQAHLEQRSSVTIPHQRGPIAAAMLAYLKRIGAPQQSLEGAKLLSHPQAKVVVTGQQAGLLGGSALTYYKIHSAIQLAKQFHTSEQPVLPVFWIASQDHDTLEINHSTVLNMQEQSKHIVLPYPNNIPAAHINLEGYAAQYNSWLEDVGGEGHFSIQPHDTPVSLMARELLEAFSTEGLLLIDPMAPEFAPLFLPHLQQELQQPLASSQAINAQAERMRQVGLKPGLTRAEGATNLFWQGQDGQRRLLHVPGVWAEQKLTDGINIWSTSELWNITLEQPHRLTPAAGLRPIMQDSVLPTLAFVVGPGELKYVSELAGVYALHNLEPSVVVQRAHVTVLEPPMVRLVEQYNLDPWLFQANWQQHMAQATAHSLDNVQHIQQALNSIDRSFAQLESAWSEPQLARALNRAKHRLNHELERLSHKTAQHALQDEKRFKHHLERLKLHLYPNMPQERLYPFAQYRFKHGSAALKQLKLLPATGRHTLYIR